MFHDEDFDELERMGRSEILLELKELDLLRLIVRQNRIILREIFRPKLSCIQIKFRRKHHMPTPGPITLTTAGQTVTASVVGFDQFGNPWTGPIPTPTFSNDNESAATLDAASGLVTAVANGVANITASLTTAEGLALTDTEAVTVAIAAPPEPVLTTIKVAFA